MDFGVGNCSIGSEIVLLVLIEFFKGLELRISLRASLAIRPPLFLADSVSGSLPCL